MARYLVISTSLNADSKSRRLARVIHRVLAESAADVAWVDLRDIDLPLCAGDESDNTAAVVELRQRVLDARGVLLAGPIYNYDLSGAAKNLVELTGRAWTGNVVGFATAAGGRGSYMAPMGLANSLMWDFRCHILPRYAYATADDFDGEAITNELLRDRLHSLAAELQRVTEALHPE